MYLINIILSVFISTIVVALTVTNLSKNKLTLKQFIKFSIIMFPLLMVINLFFAGIVKLILILVIETISLYFSIFNKDLKNSLFYSFITEILVFIIEIVLSILMVSIFKFNIEIYNNFSLSMFIFSILNGIVVLLLSKILSNVIIKFNKIVVKSQYELIYICILIILITPLITFNGFNLDNRLSFYANAGMMGFVLISLIHIVYKDFQSDKLEKKYDQMMDYVSKYEKIINEQGKKNHEYNNQLMVIKGYSKNPKKLEEYLETIIEEHKCGQNYTIRQLSNFPDGGIKGLIYHKISKMEEEGIKYYLYIDNNSKNIFEEKFDLKTYQDITKLLGVFLDNAIEATLDSEKKEIEIDIKNDDGCIILSIANTYNNKIDVKQVGKKGFTTKGIGHGYGLSIVKDITKHNDNIETLKEVDEDKFKQTAIIYYKK